MSPMSSASVALWPNRMLKIGEVVTLTGVSKATIYEWMAKGLFPHSRRIGPNRVGWAVSDVEKWCNERPIAA